MEKFDIEGVEIEFDKLTTTEKTDLVLCIDRYNLAKKRRNLLAVRAAEDVVQTIFRELFEKYGYCKRNREG